MGEQGDAVIARILVAIDLSEASDEALRQSYDRAQAIGAQMAVCLVLPGLHGIRHLLPFQSALTAPRFRDEEANVRRAIETRLAGVIPRAKPEIFVEWGRPYAEIVRRAEAWHADLVVVGSRGATGLARLLLGSVAENVVRYAHSNVLVARPAGSRGIVMAATDLSDASMPAVGAAAREAEHLQARLVIVHASNFTTQELIAGVAAPFGSAPVLPSAETLREIHSALEVAMREITATVAPHAESTVLEGSPAGVIAHHAAQIGAELLVVSTHGRTGLSRVVVGSVAERLVRLAPCSVLVVRMPPASS
jgi:nucleotide-binding universal stress UspA family protein